MLNPKELRIALMAMLLRENFPEADMDKVICMCLIHDLGEAFTGDIPTFEKNAEDEKTEEDVLNQWVNSLPDTVSKTFSDLLSEMKALNTLEAKIYKALDKLEAVIQHNESDISTWIPLEYDLQLRYGRENVAFSPYFQQLKEEIDAWTRRKISQESGKIEGI